MTTAQEPEPSSGVIAYGARCTWWDDKSKVATVDGTPEGLPCCPDCGGTLLEISEESWNAKTQEAIDRGASTYGDMVKWMRGKCFPSYEDAIEAFSMRTPDDFVGLVVHYSNGAAAHFNFAEEPIHSWEWADHSGDNHDDIPRLVIKMKKDRPADVPQRMEIPAVSIIGVEVHTPQNDEERAAAEANRGPQE